MAWRGLVRSFSLCRGKATPGRIGDVCLASRARECMGCDEEERLGTYSSRGGEFTLRGWNGYGHGRLESFRIFSLGLTIFGELQATYQVSKTRIKANIIHSTPFTDKPSPSLWFGSKNPVSVYWTQLNHGQFTCHILIRLFNPFVAVSVVA